MEDESTRGVVYRINEDPFAVSVKFKQDIPLSKDIFELKEQEPKNYKQAQSGKEYDEVEQLDPVKMNIAITKLLLTDKLISSLCLFSLVISLLMVYSDLSDNLFSYYLGNCITLLLILVCIVGEVFEIESNRARIINKHSVLACVGKILLLSGHPTIWTIEYNNILHLLMMLRLVFTLNYFIRSSVYYDSRASRLINIYGIKPEYNYFFAIKVILNQMQVSVVLLLYVAIVFIYSHCLYLSKSNQSFINCFQVVIVTLPTIGFGEYFITEEERVIILFIVVTGVGLNAFVTLSMLKQFQMTTRELNSYTLMEKLRIVSDIETLSGEYIIRKIKKSRAANGLSEERLIDEEFKEKYTECQKSYRELKLQETTYLFNHFKQSLEQLKAKVVQISNMATVLLVKFNPLRERSAKQHRRINLRPIV